MTLQRVLSYIRRAADDYHMIESGDKIAVGISGGKDSLTLLYGLHGLMRFYPQPFTIHAVTVDLGFHNLDLTGIQELCSKLEVPYTIVKTDIADIIFHERKETNPCSLCAKMRKGALNEAIKKAGCNKIAYAHHKDDVVETMLMSLIFEGRFHTFNPVTYLDRMDLTVIRPLMYMSEQDVIGFVNKFQMPVVKSPCPADGHTKREYIKNLLQKLNQENPGVKERMFTAIQNGRLEGWDNYYGKQ
ncbi:MAG: tRNA 2-thiocytidine(32) synthetase TtcA [Lachnospiraceae bacterium]|jgi:tRNA 2-thiocytidine biosynthesis protein TtcA|nr:tRNA 2-thiocytidine(32) synthetase TtcA [Lachnospiraceae bacterium]GFI15374.1 tRNA-cytidine(32) 2-sulfurtransferase [Lachnospiraceae bacterium]